MKHLPPFRRPSRTPGTATGSTSGSTSGSASGPASPEPPSVRLGWSDPVTGERLCIVFAADPEMLERLQEEGFCVESEITRTAS